MNIPAPKEILLGITLLAWISIAVEARSQSNSIIGKWMGRAPNGGMVTYEFRDNGSVLWKVSDAPSSKPPGKSPSIAAKYIVDPTTKPIGINIFDFESAELNEFTFLGVMEFKSSTEFRLLGEPKRGSNAVDRPHQIETNAILFTKVFERTAALAASQRIQTDRNVKESADRYLRSMGGFEFQHANGSRNILIPNNGRMRTLLGALQNASDRFGVSHAAIEVEHEGMTIILPKEAIRADSTNSATMTDGSKDGYGDKVVTMTVSGSSGQNSGSKRVVVQGGYLPATQKAPAASGSRKPEVSYHIYDANPLLTPLAYAGEGIFNFADNDVWIRDPKGRTFFLDGREWMKCLQYLASDGEGKVSSVKPDIIDLEARNGSVAADGWILVGIIGVAGLLIGGVLWQSRRRLMIITSQEAIPAEKQ